MRRRVLEAVAPGAPCMECGEPIAHEAHVEPGADVLCDHPWCHAAHARHHHEYMRDYAPETRDLTDHVQRVARGA